MRPRFTAAVALTATAAIALSGCTKKNDTDTAAGGGDTGSKTYKVAFVPFKDGKPAGEPQDFLTGFIANENEVYGRPVGVTQAADGSLLVTDDAANRIWRVAAEKK